MLTATTVNRYKVKDERGKKKKIRELVLCVRSDVRINNSQADDLFDAVKRAIESHPELGARPWHRVNELGRRQMVWYYEGKNAGRKVIRPIVEAAVEAWDMAAEL